MERSAPLCSLKARGRPTWQVAPLLAANLAPFALHWGLGGAVNVGLALDRLSLPVGQSASPGGASGAKLQLKSQA